MQIQSSPLPKKKAVSNLNTGQESKVGLNRSKFLKNLLGACMKNVYEVLRQKELEVSRLEIEVEALRVAAPLLTEEGEAGNGNQPRLATSTAVNATQAGRAAGWDDRAKRWP